MKKALPLIIGVIVFALLLAGYVALKKKNAADAEVVEDTLYSYSVDDITQLSFLNTIGETLSFTRTGDGWKNDASEDYKISEAKITNLLSMVASLKINNTLRDNPDLAEYGLEAPINRVSFTAADTTVTVCIGSYNSTTQSQYIYLNDDTSVIYAVQADLTNAFQLDITELVEDEDTAEDTSENTVENNESTE